MLGTNKGDFEVNQAKNTRPTTGFNLEIPSHSSWDRIRI